MTRQIEKRLQRLEGSDCDVPAGDILVCIASPNADAIEVEAEIDTMIARSEITEDDRPQCVSWWKIPNRELSSLLTRLMRDVDGVGRGLPS